jgi:hypothetical protein
MQLVKQEDAANEIEKNEAKGTRRRIIRPKKRHEKDKKNLENISRRPFDLIGPALPRRRGRKAETVLLPRWSGPRFLSCFHCSRLRSRTCGGVLVGCFALDGKIEDLGL